MQETIKRDLNFKEELTLAVFFSNVQKFNCLADMPHFRKEQITEPVQLFGNDSAPLATLLSCFKILYAVPGHEELQKRNNAIIGIIKQKTGLEITDSVDLSEYNPSGMGDILGISDYSHLYSWTLGFRNRGYGQGKEDWSTLRSHYNSVMNHALREQHLKTLENGLSEEEILRLRAFAEAEDKERHEARPFKGRPLPKEVKAFIDDIDHPGAILAVFDEGKAFARVMFPEPPYLLHSDIVAYILTATRHITIRIGGYSDRVAGVVMDVAKNLNCEPWRIEHLSMRDYVFEPESQFVQYAEQYDFKYFSMVEKLIRWCTGTSTRLTRDSTMKTAASFPSTVKTAVSRPSPTWQWFAGTKTFALPQPLCIRIPGVGVETPCSSAPPHTPTRDPAAPASGNYLRMPEYHS